MGKSQKTPNTRNKGSWTEGLRRMMRYRLQIPMKRSKHPPHFIARGVMVGMAWAMTPFLGLQMTAVFLTWLVTRRLFNWDFSLANGLAWTWTTNVFTAIPVFYIFYVTGQLLLGHFNDISGYESFKALFLGVHEPATGVWDLISKWFAGFVVGVGVPMTVGSIPWAIIAGWFSYKLSLQFVTEFRARRARAMKKAGNGGKPARSTRARSTRARSEPAP